MKHNTHKSPAAPRNLIAVAMRERYSRVTTVMKDRRAPRGGARNKQRDYRSDNF